MEHSLSELRITVDELEKSMDGLNDKSEVCILLLKFMYKILGYKLKSKLLSSGRRWLLTESCMKYSMHYSQIVSVLQSALRQDWVDLVDRQILTDYKRSLMNAVSAM